MIKSTKKAILVLLLLIIMTISLVLVLAFKKRSENRTNYNKANEYINSGNYSEAAKVLDKLNTYKDSENLMKKAQKGLIYLEANKLLENEKYDEAIEHFNQIIDFKDSKKKIKKAKYNLAIQYFENEDYDKSKQLFEELNNFGESKSYLDKIDRKNVEKLTKTIYDKACKQLKHGKYSEALENFNAILDYEDSKEKAKICKNKLEEQQRLSLSHKIVACIDYILAITPNNEVEYNGINLYGEFIDISSWENIVSVDGYGEATIGLKSNGNIKITGNLTKEQKEKITDWKHIVDIAAGEKYVVGLKSTGEVVAEGHNGNGQCNVDNDNWKNVIDIDAGWSLTVGLTKDGELLFTGKNSKELHSEYKLKKEEWKDVIKISVSGGEAGGNHRGGGHVVGLKSDGSVIAIGDNTYGQCDVNSSEWKENSIIAVSAGDWYTVGLTDKGKILITGENYPNGLPHTKYIESEKINSWRDIQDISAGYGITLVLKNDGHLDVMGFTNELQPDIIQEWEISAKK